MDVFDCQKITPNLNSEVLNTESKPDKNNPLISPSKRDLFFNSSRQQPFSIPADSIVYYILKNPSTPEIYLKLIKSCKYFFINNPILIASDIDFKRNKHQSWVNINLKSTFDLKNISIKFWLDNKLHIDSYPDSEEPNFLSSVIPKIYKSDIKRLSVYNQNILFNDFMFLASKCNEFSFEKVTVMNDDGSIVPLEKLVEILPDIKNIDYCLLQNSSDIVTAETLQNLLKIPHFSNLDYFVLNQVPETFDIESFYNYFKKNKKTKIALAFDDKISEGYESRLLTVINEILETENHEYMPPWIDFDGMPVMATKSLLSVCRDIFSISH